jgi:hypothetical protein
MSGMQVSFEDITIPQEGITKNLLSRVAQGKHTLTLSQVGSRTGAVSHRLPLAVSAVSSFVPG